MLKQNGFSLSLLFMHHNWFGPLTIYFCSWNWCTCLRATPSWLSSFNATRTVSLSTNMLFVRKRLCIMRYPICEPLVENKLKICEQLVKNKIKFYIKHHIKRHFSFSFHEPFKIGCSVQTIAFVPWWDESMSTILLRDKTCPKINDN